MSEKHIHVHPKDLYLPEWIIFTTMDGQQIKAYSSAGSFGSERRALSTFHVGDKGTLYYRKNKKYNYFQEFKKFESESEITNTEIENQLI